MLPKDLPPNFIPQLNSILEQFDPLTPISLIQIACTAPFFQFHEDSQNQLYRQLNRLVKRIPQDLSSGFDQALVAVREIETDVESTPIRYTKIGELPQFDPEQLTTLKPQVNIEWANVLFQATQGLFQK